MKLFAFNIKPKKTRSGNPKLVMIQVNPDEALKIIKSLTAQMISKNPNTERLEVDTECGTYFSIAVEPFKEVEPTFHSCKRKGCIECGNL